MTRQTRDQPAVPGQPRAPATDDRNLKRQKAETEEVVGRHKNDGRKDHQGTRTLNKGTRDQGST